jgi:hypothetical protein
MASCVNAVGIISGCDFTVTARKSKQNAQRKLCAILLVEK